MQLEVQSALIGVFVTVAVMTSLLLRRRRRRTDALFAVLCVVLLLWFAGAFLDGAYGPQPWLRLELGVAALIPAGIIRLFAELVPWHTERGRKLMTSAYTLSGLSAVAAISPLGPSAAARAFSANMRRSPSIQALTASPVPSEAAGPSARGQSNAVPNAPTCSNQTRRR